MKKIFDFKMYFGFIIFNDNMIKFLKIMYCKRVRFFL